METMRRLRDGFGRAWGTLAEGWRQLFRRAGGALTRFRADGDGELTTFADGNFVTRNAGWGLLAAEVSEDDRRIVVRLEAPGMERDDFDIEVIGDTLIVRGEKRYRREDDSGDYYLAECAYGSFTRTIALPDEVEAGRARARYKRGVLSIELPRAAIQRRHRLRIA